MERLEQRRAGDDSADVRAGPLVGARRVEVGTERGDLDGAMRRRVHTVDIGERADLVRLAGNSMKPNEVE